MTSPVQFSPLARILHWLMAVAILCMIFIGVFMAATLGPVYHHLVMTHISLGFVVLALGVIRLTNRLLTVAPELPGSVPAIEKRVAITSEVMLYTFMLLMPLIGWSMLSAGGYPVVAFGGALHMPAIQPHNPPVYAFLRHLHKWLGYGLFALIIAHLSAILFHSIVLGDGLLNRMSPINNSPKD